MNLSDDFKLCYVEDSRAYFTDCPLEKQWGDDWNDAPYEHNAGQPYDTTYENDTRVKHNIMRFPFVSSLVTPSEYVDNSGFSVEDINSGAVAWLRTGREFARLPKVNIFAGATFREFVDKVRQAGGTVYIPFDDEFEIAQ